VNNKQLRIGINSRLFQNRETGIPYFIKCLYKEILDKDKKNKYIFFQTNSTKKIGNTKTINLPNSNLYNIFFDTIGILYLVLKNKINILHGPSNILPIIKLPGVKYILTVHDLSFLVFPNQYPKIFNLYYRYLTEISLKNADIVVSDSLSTKSDIIKYYGVSPEKIKVIYLGVNDIFDTKIKVPRLIQDKYIFSITTHPKRKNIFGVLEALALCKDKVNYKYVIAGLIQKTYLDELNKKIKMLKLEEKVILFGYADESELISLYQNAEFFVYPSFYEGFGLPVVEAMSCKCPVIVANNSSLVEVVPNKKWTVNPYDTSNIAQKMIQMAKITQQERKQLILENLNFSKQFRWNKTSNSYINIFTGLQNEQ
jgi:glycosyltransferase involved in cell wall biosynthesis